MALKSIVCNMYVRRYLSMKWKKFQSCQQNCFYAKIYIVELIKFETNKVFSEVLLSNGFIRLYCDRSSELADDELRRTVHSDLFHSPLKKKRRKISKTRHIWSYNAPRDNVICHQKGLYKSDLFSKILWVTYFKWIFITALKYKIDNVQKSVLCYKQRKYIRKILCLL